MASNAIDMELENTMFLITLVQFSVVRIIILFIQFSNTVQNTSYFVMYSTCQAFGYFAEKKTNLAGFLGLISR